MDKQKPHLIIITGRPAAGKSTLSKWLSKELGIPCVSKDTIREVLFDRFGWKDRKWAQLLGRSSIDIMFYFSEMQLEAGCSLILDNYFNPSLSEPRFQALKNKYAVETIQVICNSDRDTLFTRFKERAKTGNRHPGHGDEDVFNELHENLAKEESPVMEIGGSVIEVDTSDFSKVDYAAILNEIKAVLGSQ